VRTTGVLVLAMCLALLGTSPASGQEVAPPFDESYTWDDLGQPPEVPAPLGGLTLKAGTTDRLLIGGAANTENGALYEIGLLRGDDGHIVGFSGPGTRFADAEYNDGGVAYGPDGVLFLARWPVNQLGQTKPSSASTDRIVDMSRFEVAPSLASLQFVPDGRPGEGSLKLASYPGGEWYDAEVKPDGTGTFDVTSVTPVPDSTLLGGPEGFVFVGAGSPHFDGPSLLVSEWDAGQVAAYDVDANGDPIVSTRRDFIVGLDGAEGAFIDPQTGDFLFSTFGGGDRVIVVRGFAAPSSIAVQTSVTNDNGGVLAPADFTVRVRDGGGDVAGSPQPGSENGAVYVVESGKAYTVSVDPVPGYLTSIGGDCAADGTVVVNGGVQPVCMITANDVTAPPPPQVVVQSSPPQVVLQQPPAQELPPPVAGEKVNAVPKSGTVRVKLPGSNKFVELEAGQQVPIGTVLDTRKGRVTLVAASNKSGGTATADFYDGVFKVGQTKGAKPITTLKLVEKLSCARGRAGTAAKRKKKRRLWGDGSGKFRTDGEFSSATVRGTKWLVEDRCDSTLTRVTRGAVAVRDLVKRKTVIVRAGKQYVARRRR